MSMNSHVPVQVHFRPQPESRQMPPRASEPARTLASDDLFRGRTEIAIDHFGAVYRLRITRQGKLILNK
jgi:hemin uptake protein HemP